MIKAVPWSEILTKKWFPHLVGLLALVVSVLALVAVSIQAELMRRQTLLLERAQNMSEFELLPDEVIITHRHNGNLKKTHIPKKEWDRISSELAFRSADGARLGNYGTFRCRIEPANSGQSAE
jgi:hypothetical protein